MLCLFRNLQSLQLCVAVSLQPCSPQDGYVSGLVEHYVTYINETYHNSGPPGKSVILNALLDKSLKIGFYIQNLLVRLNDKHNWL